MKIAIHNPNNLPTIDYRKVKPLQGNLKDLTEKNYNKLKGVLAKRGFEVPLFLWFDGDIAYYLDGHQRQRVMAGEDMSDNGNYEVPYVRIEAKDKKEAKEKLLEITSQYGKITYEGFDELVADLPEAEVIEAVSFDALPHLGEEMPDDADWADAFDDENMPKALQGLRQMTFVLPAAKVNEVTTKLKEVDEDKNRALLLALGIEIHEVVTNDSKADNESAG